MFGEKSAAGFEAADGGTVFDAQYGLAPAQPDDWFRVWGVNPFARSPAAGSKVSEAAPRQSGYRMPQRVKKERCAQPGAFPAAPYYDASLTAHGVQKVEMSPGGKESASPAEANAVALGTLFKWRFAEFTGGPDASEPLEYNVTAFSGSYELEHVFERRSPRLRLGGPMMAMSSPDVPTSCTSPERLLRKMFRDKWAPGASRRGIAACTGRFPPRRNCVVACAGADSRSSLPLVRRPRYRCWSLRVCR